MRSSRRQVLKYAVPAVVSAVAGPAVLAATGRVPQASADGMKLIDFAVRQVSPEAIKAAGYDGVLVYVSQLRPGATFDLA